MFGDSEVSTTFAAANTGVAQLVEHRSPKPGVYHRGLVTPDTVIVGSVDFKVIRTGRYFRVHDCALLCICSDPRITISFQPVFEAVFFRDMIIVGRKLKTEVYLVIIKDNTIKCIVECIVGMNRLVVNKEI